MLTLHRNLGFAAIASLAALASSAHNAPGDPPVDQVNVVNPAAMPALTSSVDDPGRIPCQELVLSMGRVGQVSCTFTDGGSRLAQEACLRTLRFAQRRYACDWNRTLIRNPRLYRAPCRLGWRGVGSGTPDGGTVMHRITQFDMYRLGRVRALSELIVGDTIARFNELFIITIQTLDSFSKDPINVSVLPRSTDEATKLANYITEIHYNSVGQGRIGTTLKTTDHYYLSKLIVAFETTLRQELTELPTYIVQNNGIYNADDLVSRADNCFALSIRSFIPKDAAEDIREAGSCLALDRFTACGFHAFRSVDGMLRAYIGHFGKGKTPPRSRNWGAFIRELQNLVTNPVAGRAPNDRTIALIDRIREVDRNPLIHPQQDLNKDDAISSFDLCRNVITLMATDMKDKP